MILIILLIIVAIFLIWKYMYKTELQQFYQTFAPQPNLDLKNPNRVEHFQYILQENGEYVPIPYVRTYNKNIMVEVPIVDVYACQTLCDQTPNCSGYNFAIGNCAIYRNLDFKPEKTTEIKPINPIVENRYRCTNLTGCSATQQ